jgi:diguanylate cyclase (GGDEF)-like protein
METLPALASITAAALAGGAAWRLHLRVRWVEAEARRLRQLLQTERHAAVHDPLTGLLNRRGFFRHGDALLADTSRHPLIAVVVDLDDLKQINDRLGHAAGDQALIAVAKRFAAWARGGQHVVARLGGDEFAGLLTTPTTERGWLDRASTGLAGALAAPIELGGQSVRVTASVGLVPVPASTPLADTLRLADAAMYRAKSARRSNADGEHLPWQPLTSIPSTATLHPWRPRTATAGPIGSGFIGAVPGAPAWSSPLRRMPPP